MTTGVVTHLNPPELHQNPAFTQVVVTSGPVKTIYVGGQNAANAQGEIVGKGNLAAQVEQVFRNLEHALAAGGAELGHVIKWTIYAMQGQPVAEAMPVFQRVWNRRPNPPLITVVYVAGLANPDFLVELEAIAVVPLAAD